MDSVSVTLPISLIRYSRSCVGWCLSRANIESGWGALTFIDSDIQFAHFSNSFKKLH